MSKRETTPFWRDRIYELGLAQAVRQNSSHNFVWLTPYPSLFQNLNLVEPVPDNELWNLNLVEPEPERSFIFQPNILLKTKFSSVVYFNFRNLSLELVRLGKHLVEIWFRLFHFGKTLFSTGGGQKHLWACHWKFYFRNLSLKNTN